MIDDIIKQERQKLQDFELETIEYLQNIRRRLSRDVRNLIGDLLDGEIENFRKQLAKSALSVSNSYANRQVSRAFDVLGNNISSELGIGGDFGRQVSSFGTNILGSSFGLGGFGGQASQNYNILGSALNLFGSGIGGIFSTGGIVGSYSNSLGGRSSLQISKANNMAISKASRNL